MRKRMDTGMAAVETDYPHVAEWVDGCGWIEVGTHFEPNPESKETFVDGGPRAWFAVIRRGS